MAINRPILAHAHIVHMFILYFCFRFCLLYIFVCMYFFFFFFLTTILVNKDVYLYIITPDGSQTYSYTNSNIHSYT